jgi:putative ABC transport system permease protein
VRLDLRLALRNVLRQRHRTLSAVGAITIGVASIIVAGGFVQDIFRHLAEATIRSQTGHLQIAGAGFFTTGSRSPEKFIIADPQAVGSRLSAQRGVVDRTARLMISGLLGNGRTDLAVFGEGVEPAGEARLGTYVNVLEGRRLEEADRFGIVVGEGVAQSLKLGIGDPVSLVVSTAQGAMNALDFEVVGISRSFSKEYDARSVKVPLAAAQTLLDTKGANVIVLTVERTPQAAAVAREIAPLLVPLALEVKVWHELSDFYGKAVELYARQFGVLQLIVVLMVILGTVNCVNTTTFERVHEFGTMRALGNRNADVAALVVTETVLLGLAGATAGVALGALLAAAISAVGIPMPPVPNSNLGYTARIAFEPAAAGGAFALGVAASLAASVPAAIRVSRVPIVDALRQAV